MKQLITMLNQCSHHIPIALTTSSIQLRIVLNSSKLVEVNFKIDKPNFSVEISERSYHESIFSNLNTNGMTVKQWIEHIVPVLCGNNRAGVALTFRDMPRRNIEEMHDYIKDLRILELDVVSSEIQDTWLSKLFPSLETLKVQNVPMCTSMLTQNFETLKLSQIKVTLDDVLILNSSQLSIWLHSLSDKDLNLLMKLWMKGSMSRLERFELCFPTLEQDRLVEKDLFQGFEFSIQESVQWEKRVEIERRDDGAKAIVTFATLLCNSFCMTVKE